MRFAFNSMMKSCHSNKKTVFGTGHVTYDVIIPDVTWGDILWQMLFCCGLTFLCLKNCQSYKAFSFFKNNASKDYSGIFYMIIIIYFYNYFTFV